MRNLMIVEDEPLIAMLLEDYLELLDRHIVCTAASVAEAMACMEKNQVDAAILDVNLRDGEKIWPVANALAAAGIPFVLATGGSGDSIAPEHRDRPVLAKPYAMEAVRQALAAMA